MILWLYGLYGTKCRMLSWYNPQYTSTEYHNVSIWYCIPLSSHDCEHIYHQKHNTYTNTAHIRTHHINIQCDIRISINTAKSLVSVKTMEWMESEPAMLTKKLYKYRRTSKNLLVSWNMWSVLTSRWRQYLKQPFRSLHVAVHVFSSC